MASRNTMSSSGLVYNGDIGDLPSFLYNVTAQGYEFMAVPLVNAHVFEVDNNSADQDMVHVEKCGEETTLPLAKFSRWSDLTLSSNEWSTKIVAVVKLNSSSHSLPPSTSAGAFSGASALRRQLDLAIHLSVSAVIVDLPESETDLLPFAQIISSYMAHNSHIRHIWLRINWADKTGWLRWHTIRSMVDHDTRLSVALTIGSKANEISATESSRWLGEPVKCVVVSQSNFAANSKGFPVLTKDVKMAMRPFFKLHVQFLVEMVESLHFGEDGQQPSCPIANYQAFIEHLWTTHFASTSPDQDDKSVSVEKESVYKEFTSGYEDYLQMPLQPLMDNLESATYEVFERDPIKYELYEEAITEAVRHLDIAYRQKAKCDALTDDDVEQQGEDVKPVVNIMVLGAGRGPLVQAVIDAATCVAAELNGPISALAFKIRIFAVEKNQHAALSLRAKMASAWAGHDVTLVACDMRHWQPTAADLAHVVISELLGSFGDNELSPECLYGAQHLLQTRNVDRDGGLTPISIPERYTSYLAPVQSAKLYSEVRGQLTEFSGAPTAKLGPFEMPYVVHLNNVNVLAEPKPLFTFQHPSSSCQSDLLPDLNRHGRLTFEASTDCVVHGLAGYFDCHLYGEVQMSIVPSTHSPGMFSWFPILFPLRQPVTLKAGQKLTVAIWRVNNKAKVWYEWTVVEPVPLPIHNPNGRTYTIGL